jgi:membrane protease YdiL (CAAX protease family)
MKDFQCEMAATLADGSEVYHVLDTTLIPAVVRVRACRKSLFAVQAAFGRCVSKIEWNYGFKVALLITWTFGFIVNGIAGPIVEEIYFRGYLLPRISRLGAWAPLLNTVLFSLYHFFTPWLNVSRIIGLLPMVYAAWWKKSIYVSMAVHVLGNAIPMLFLLAGLL